MGFDVKMDLSELRKEYKLKHLRRSDLNSNPIEQFEIWFKEAIDAKIYEPNAMALATFDENGPSSRMVLLKKFSEKGFLFFTHHLSRKARQIQTHPKAAALFFWKELERQVQIEGPVERVGREMAEAYFQRRPRTSQIAAWASRQDGILESRATLEESTKYYQDFFLNQEVPMPDWWGGYLIIPLRIEFWQGRESRLHDRFLYLKENEKWQLSRLSP